MTRTTATNVSTPKSVRAFCPSGTVLTGGGYSTSVISTELTLRLSTSEGKSWEANVAELPGSRTTSRGRSSAHAICATRTG